MKQVIIFILSIFILSTLVYAAPAGNVSIISNSPLSNNTNSIFNISLTGNGECNGGNTTWWNSSDTTRKQILGLDFNVNETDDNFWDYTGNNNNATCSGSTCPTYNASCGVDGSGCYNFNGTYKLTSQIINITNSTTINLFISPNTINQVSKLIFSGDASPGAWTIYINTGLVAFQIYNGTGFETSSSFSVSSNVFSMISVVYNKNKTVDLFKNGKLNISSNFGNVLPSVDKPLLIGGQDSAFGLSYFNGSIDNVKIWNYALTPQQISEEYNATIQKRSPRLLAEQTTTGDIWTANAVCSNTTSYSNVSSQNLRITDYGISYFAPNVLSINDINTNNYYDRTVKEFYGNIPRLPDNENQYQASFIITPNIANQTINVTFPLQDQINAYKAGFANTTRIDLSTIKVCYGSIYGGRTCTTNYTMGLI